MKVLLTGSAGQLGQELLASRPEAFELIATRRGGGEGMLALDLADAEACKQMVQTHRPDWVVNAGAYTAVDRAESEPDVAQAVNAGAPAAFAEALLETGGHLLQLSTDFVFSGQQGYPYHVYQQRTPLCTYGKSKAQGEEAVEQLLGTSRSTILRTSWVYGPVGRNFLLTMLRLHRERDQLSVVADQVGCPTSTYGLAQACWAVISRTIVGHHHWSDAGAASWYDFAVAIGELAMSKGLLQKAARVNPITTAEYPTPAVRPSYSLLDCSVTRQELGLAACHWRRALAQVIVNVEG